MRRNNYTKKFIGFEIPDEALYGYDWIHDVITDRGTTIFYTIDATNYDEAKNKLFNELCSEWGQDVVLSLATHRARHIMEDDDENTIISKYGGQDGRIIIQISGEFLDLNEEAQEEFPLLDETVKQLSEETIYELAFECKEIDLGIVDVTKNL